MRNALILERMKAQKLESMISEIKLKAENEKQSCIAKISSLKEANARLRNELKTKRQTNFCPNGTNEKYKKLQLENTKLYQQLDKAVKNSQRTPILAVKYNAVSYTHLTLPTICSV
eukprot:TRINITY_DN16823_c0_g1_i1.p2 TRINITY_DN16823_c0_g1~~TRINITY_DN16823_c0_g1_i1.p2  ORF type:complete len:116 (-),score=17.67 TRINITY_DN16823_c0_g1_i1:12-359(-)